MVRGMTRSTGDIVFFMDRINSLHMFGAGCVTGQAPRIDFFGRVICENENLCYVPAALDVSGTSTVTAFASLVRRAAFCVECCFPVGSFLPPVIDIFVAGLARFGTDVIWRLRNIRGRRVCALGRLALPLLR